MEAVTSDPEDQLEAEAQQRKEEDTEEVKEVKEDSSPDEEDAEREDSGEHEKTLIRRSTWDTERKLQVDISNDDEVSRSKSVAASPKHLSDLNKWLEEFAAEDEDEEDQDLMERLAEEEKELADFNLPQDEPWECTSENKAVEDSKRKLECQFDMTQKIVAFEKQAKQTQLSIANLSKEDAAKRFEVLKEKRRQDKEKIKAVLEKEQADIAQREKEARDRVLALQKEKQKAIARKKREFASQVERIQPRLRREFKKRQDAFMELIKAQDAHVKEKYGSLLPDWTYNPRHLLIDTSARVPQEMTLNFRFAHGIKDKLPRGKYTLVAYLLDELGGVPLRYSKGTRYPALTIPFWHYGKFSDFVTTINRHVALVCPPLVRASPSNVFIIELYQNLQEWGKPKTLGTDALADPSVTRFSKVVGWTALPMVDGNGKFLEGCYRLPMIKGAYNNHFDRYYKLEKAYARELDAWLCNVYVRVGKSFQEPPRIRSERLDFVDELKSLFPNPDEPPKAIVGEKKSLVSSAFSKLRLRKFLPSSNLKKIVPHHGPEIEPAKGDSDQDAKQLERSLFKEEVASLQKPLEDVHSYDAKLELFEYAVERNPKVHKESAFRSLEYLRHEILTTFKRTRWRLNEFWMTICLFSLAFWVRLYTHYFSQFFFLQYTGFAAVYDFQLLLHRCVLKYSTLTMPLSQQVGVVFVGTLSNVGVFLVLGFCSLVLSRVTDTYPDALYNFLTFFGLLTIGDPLLVLLMDSISLRYFCSDVCQVDIFSSDCQCSQSDVTRVLNHFRRFEGSEMNAWFLILLVYFTLIALSSAVFAVFFVFLNRAGRGQDLYRRLHLSEEWFCVPQDAEVTPQYVALVRHRADQWRGPAGQRRVVVHASSPTEGETLTILQTTENDPDPVKNGKLWRRFVIDLQGTLFEDFSSPQ